MGSNHRLPATVVFLLSTTLCAGRAAAALTIDGKLDPEYGPAIVVQSIQTDLTGTNITGDNMDNDLNFAGGSELDGAYAVISNNVLYLFFAGNLARRAERQRKRDLPPRPRRVRGRGARRPEPDPPVRPEQPAQ